MNFGVVLAITGGNALAYTDRLGGARTAATNLSSAAWRASDVIELGLGARCLVTVKGTLGGGQSVKVRLELRHTDDSGITFPWALIGCDRGDAPGNVLVEQTIVDTDLVGPSVGGDAARAVVLLTENTGPSGSFRVIVEAVNAPAATDVLVVAVETK